MGRHARHNTRGHQSHTALNAASFTYHERQQAKEECILTNLLAQKKDMKRQTLLLERMRTDSEAEMAAARAAARDRVLREFESTQSSLGNGPAPAGASAGSEGRDGGAAGDGAPRGTKRSFQLDEDEIERLTNEATEKALRKTTQEMADARKAKLPNYWLPSLTPSATPETVTDVKLQTLCQASKPPHPISLKSLTEVKFTEEPRDKDSRGEPVISCPSCRKTITNNVKSYVLKACGDVLCSTCVDTLCRTDKACAQCGTPTDKKKPFIEISREGTGYASGGGVEVKRFDIAFQA
ncbi:hypothetical protein JCM8202v2_004193 [Rhodotorula sphaerocarpa]